MDQQPKGLPECPIGGLEQAFTTPSHIFRSRCGSTIDNFRAIFGHTLNLGLPCYAHLSVAAFLIYIPSNPIRLVNEGAILEV